jgi:hypothetical protein
MDNPLFVVHGEGSWSKTIFLNLQTQTLGAEYLKEKKLNFYS